MSDAQTQVDETTTTTESGTSTTETGRDGKPFDAERAQRLIDQQRDEIRTLKAAQKDLAAAQARLREIDDASKSETERLASKAQEAEAKLTAAEQRAADLALQMAVERAARKLGFIDEDDAYRLIDRKAVELDDDGEPKNVDALLKDLAKAKPHLIAAEDGKANSGNGTATQRVPSTPKPNGRADTRDDLVKRAEERLAGSGRYGRL